MQPNWVNVQSLSKDFDVQWHSIRSIWKQLEGSSARPAPGPRPGFGAPGPHVRVRRVRRVLMIVGRVSRDLANCRGADNF